MDIDRRDQLLFGEDFNPDKYPGGCRNFTRLSLEMANALVQDGFLTPDSRHNDSPTAGEIISIMEKYPFIHAHGYAISPQRDDCRVTLEGICWNQEEDDGEMSEELLMDLHIFRLADEYEITNDSLWIWYD